MEFTHKFAGAVFVEEGGKGAGGVKLEFEIL